MAVTRKSTAVRLSEAGAFLDAEPGSKQGFSRRSSSRSTNFFGHFASLFSSVSDPRNRKKPPVGGLAFAAVMMYLCQLKARRQIGKLLRTTASMETFSGLFKVESVPHGDTVNDGFCGMEPEQIQAVVCDMIAMLIRKKVLYPYRVLGKYFAIAGDGTGTLSLSRRHCPYCLTQTKWARLLTPPWFLKPNWLLPMDLPSP